MMGECIMTMVTQARRLGVSWTPLSLVPGALVHLPHQQLQIVIALISGWRKNQGGEVSLGDCVLKGQLYPQLATISQTSTPTKATTPPCNNLPLDIGRYKSVSKIKMLIPNAHKLNLKILKFNSTNNKPMLKFLELLSLYSTLTN